MREDKKEFDKLTSYRLPYIAEQFDEARKDIWSYLELSDEGWDGYQAEPISMATVKRAIKALAIVHDFFKNNTGLLNNRHLEVETCPSGDGCIHITVEYDRTFSFEIEANPEKDPHEMYFLFWPKHRSILDGQRTIADTRYVYQHFSMAFSKDRLTKDGKLDDLLPLLHEGFFVKKWKFSPSGYEERLVSLEDNIERQKTLTDCDRSGIIRSLEAERARLTKELRGEAP